MSTEPKMLPEAFKSYEDGKQRRYGLLFAVHGGAFVIAKLMYDKEPPNLGHLSPLLLSAGMVVFTLAMVRDIYVFGSTMRDEYELRVFGPPGKQLLAVIGFIICAGWLLVACK